MHTTASLVVCCVVVFIVGYWLGVTDLAGFLDDDDDDNPWEWDDEEL